MKNGHIRLQNWIEAIRNEGLNAEVETLGELSGDVSLEKVAVWNQDGKIETLILVSRNDIETYSHMQGRMFSDDVQELFNKIKNR